MIDTAEFSRKIGVHNAVTQSYERLIDREKEREKDAINHLKRQIQAGEEVDDIWKALELLAIPRLDFIKKIRERIAGNKGHLLALIYTDQQRTRYGGPGTDPRYREVKKIIVGEQEHDVLDIDLATLTIHMPLQLPVLFSSNFSTSLEVISEKSKIPPLYTSLANEDALTDLYRILGSFTALIDPPRVIVGDNKIRQLFRHNSFAGDELFRKVAEKLYVERVANS